VAVLAAASAGCGGDDDSSLRIVSFAGYVEDGSSDPAVDWVTPFEQRTGCRVELRQADTSDDVVRLMRTGEYDMAIASGDVVGRLVASGALAPIELARIPNARGLDRRLIEPGTAGRQTYALPQAWGANLLMWRTDVVRPAPRSWGVVFDERSPYSGKVTAYDNPITIADAALYLAATRPELAIGDVYELDDRQFRAVLDLVRRQRKVIGTYWWDFVREQAAFGAGTSVVGTTWQLVADELVADGVPVATTVPDEGATGWVDGWAVSSTARHTDCAYRWMDWMLSPRVRAQGAEWYGAAPANAAACDLTTDREHCARYGPRGLLSGRIHLWKAPRRACGDGRGAVCKDYADWIEGWEDARKLAAD
jgi:putative spermidine/putrescine transport system substrate-binding protein